MAGKRISDDYPSASFESFRGCFSACGERGIGGGAAMAALIRSRVRVQSASVRGASEKFGIGQRDFGMKPGGNGRVGVFIVVEVMEKMGAKVVRRMRRRHCCILDVG